jgi:ketosteroid isomerase-like protein
MSQEENVERLRQGLDAFARRDEAAWNELADPELEVVPVPDWPEGAIRGREAAWDFFIAAEEPWEPGSFEMVEVIDSDDKVVTHLKRDMRGKSSGVEVQYDYWLMAVIRNRKALRLEWFETREEALEAAGLQE